MAQPSRTEAIKAVVLAELERRQPEIDADRSIERIDLIVLIPRRPLGGYRVQYRKACSPLEGLPVTSTTPAGRTPI